MNDEIKEINIPNDILAILGDLTNGAMNYYKNPKVIELKYKLLLDYITNLQEENERLKEIVENLTTMTVCGDRKQIKSTAQYKLDIYKSRNEKAISYYYKTLKEYETKRAIMPLEAVEMFNILEGNK